MPRMAILIEASKLKDHDDLPGARTDVESYERFLKSDFGGAWEDSEIVVMSHPSKNHLQRSIQLAGHSDYSFVTFSGHGRHVIGKGVNETRLCINNTEEIAVHELNPENPHSLIVADACRKVTLLEAEALKYSRAFQMSLKEAEQRLRPNRARCRQVFDQAVAAAEKGPIYFYSCDLNEAASDIPSFSSQLVEAGEKWAEVGKQGVFHSNAAFRAAAEATTKRNKQQNPKSEAGRRTVHFPFAVLAY